MADIKHIKELIEEIDLCRRLLGYRREKEDRRQSKERRLNYKRKINGIQL